MSGRMTITDTQHRRVAWLIILLLFAGSVLNKLDCLLPERNS